ncbi:hypothetical protein [Actinomycetospora sp. TBRC 11914]|uniref:hypothetical protein n=1 Tax=Actinomycetospora sp. TBRC 11914 TaxID=2729387 RepID=UPI00145C5CDD|nr:hypothetical protein [Actinomycetospora sp. TBRC 11914]NMO91711.1 hypothetical protein [Actinomycetospora sp. TBRC 11914]
MTDAITTAPARSFATLADGAVARGAHFAVALHEGGRGPVTVASDGETMVLLPDVGATVSGSASTCEAPRRSICILPPGRHVVQRAAAGTCVVLRGDPDAVAGPPGEGRDPRLVVPVPHRRRRPENRIVVHAVDELPRTGAGGRLRMVQSSTLSINWVEYDGPRDRSTLSPHAHRDFEQGTLALQGDYLHHLRVPWGPDADRWRPDEHLEAGSPSLLVIPAGTEHTTEGVGAGPHLMIDLFSPPRADFIARGMVANADDYVAD